MPVGGEILSRQRRFFQVSKTVPLPEILSSSLRRDSSQALYSGAKKLKKGQGQSEVKMNSFAPTIRAEHHGQIEFRRHANNPDGLPERRLTVRECGLIQTFAPDFIHSTDHTMTRAYRYIGNAVPPLLGYLIARKVQSVLEMYFDFNPTFADSNPTNVDSNPSAFVSDHAPSIIPL